MADDQRPQFFYDLASPFAALAAFRIHDVLPVAPVWRPIWAAPVVAASGRNWRPTAEEAYARRADVEARAARYGMPPWRWPSTHRGPDEIDVTTWEPPNTLNLMRLATYAEQHGLGEAFARRVFELAFSDGRDISVIDEQVIDVATACGLDPDDARGAPGRPEVKAALRECTDAAIALGVVGIPTVVVGDQPFWGDDRLEEAAAAVTAT